MKDGEEVCVLLGSNLVDASILALVDTVLDKDIADLEAEGDVRREVLRAEESWVTALLDEQLEDVLAEVDQVLVVLEDDLDGLLEHTVGLGDSLHTTQALQLEMSALETVLGGGQLVDLIHGHTSGGQDAVKLGGQNHSNVRLATRNQCTIAEGWCAAHNVEHGLDVLEVDVQTEPVGEQAGASVGDEGNLGGLENLLVDDNGLVLRLARASDDSRGNQSQSGNQRGGDLHCWTGEDGDGREREGEKRVLCKRYEDREYQGRKLEKMCEMEPF